MGKVRGVETRQHAQPCIAKRKPTRKDFDHADASMREALINYAHGQAHLEDQARLEGSLAQ